MAGLRYRARVGFVDAAQETEVAFLLKRHAVSLSFGSSTIYTFDLEGRLYGAFVSGRNYRCGLDGRILEKWTDRGRPTPHRGCRELSSTDAGSFLDAAARRVTATGQALEHGAVTLEYAEPEGAVDIAVRWMARIGLQDGRTLKTQEEQFGQVYRRVSILPPDQYMALVVQATEGCPWNRCTFCDFYRDRTFQVRSPAALRRHIAAVKCFLGAGIRLRQSIFLGDANAMTIPWDGLRETVEVVRDAFDHGPGPPGDRIFAFTDAFGVGRRCREELRWLAEHGLRRVYIGLETGHDPLLSLVRKQGRARDAVAAVRELKAGGIGAGVIVMLGLGGDRFSDAHVQDTVDALAEMRLGRGDILYFSEMVAPPHLLYARQAAERGIRPLETDEMRDQMARVCAGLSTGWGDGQPEISVYDIRRFVY